MCSIWKKKEEEKKKKKNTLVTSINSHDIILVLF